jgi:uncharacterized DUF497 family protein
LWDEEKEKTNVIKHNLSFSSASLVFADHRAIYMDDLEHSDGEFREIALRKIGNLMVSVVILVERSDKEEVIIRIVSATKATSKEEAQYYSDEIN